MRRKGIVKAAVLALAALLLILPVAGCGGKGGGGAKLSKSAYEKKLKNVGTRLQNTFQSLRSSPGSLDELAKQLGKGQSELRKAADDLDSVTPPTDVKADHKKLIKAMRTIADDLEPLKRAADEGDPAKAQEAAQKLQRSGAVQDAQRATEDMKSKGYDTGPIGRNG
jgi:hypothetical protein